ncbi:bifunctional non-homologous end joining protein LigD [Flavimobilis soli]|uniref:Bifunctional non-homologous end joining protein LigD n=1 Tax=Flavimobilis soli TaxID=442709 RepID=A0A2A9E937_9MICO|nr:non-homologous end-joining DNA ligase [Flavimobilis soli]PFG35333.1 bifunctional non-homologous end joining protein LigD [Flavimobilis soli]
MARTTTVEVDGRSLRVTNLDKVIYPVTGTTKGEVIDYYLAIAPVMIPHVAGRPVTRKRWVNGVGTADEPGQVFFEKNLAASAPRWVHRHDLAHSDHTNTYPLVEEQDGAATLAWFAQLAALEVHVPQWRFADDTTSRGKVVHHPDRMVLDLDPGPGAGLPECVAVARLCREIVSGMGLDLVPVTSGSKGIHLYARLDGTLASDDVSAVAHELARSLEADHPDLVVSDMKKSLRKGRVLVDWSQNSGNKTTVAPYSLRGRERPAVAAPRTWDELDDDLTQLGPHEVLDRVARLGDPMAVAGTGEGAEDRLAQYRAKRDEARTPEPFTSSRRDGDGRPTFVIQDHHASRHHHDFRLEHDGVLLSWALPRLTPSSTGRNNLAVQTEDHPLDYGSFEGTIPKGEYGAGTVTIWDAGTYEAEKMRDDEIIVELAGRPDGGLANDGGPQPPMFVLIRTDAEKRQWLIHRMDKRKHLESLRRRGLKPGRSEDDAADGAAKDGEAREGAAQEGAAKEGEAKDGVAKGATTGRTSGKAATRAAKGGAHGGDEVAVAGGDERGSTAHVAAAAPSDLPQDVSPMLASSTDAVARRDLARAGTDDSPWVLEMKWDGIRAILSVDPAARTWSVRTRGGHDVTAGYPELAEILDRVHVPAVLDGEIIAPGPDGTPEFGRLQTRLGLTAPATSSAPAAPRPSSSCCSTSCTREGKT